MAYTSEALEKISKNLVCGNCNSVFHGSASQAKHFKYESKIAYCSKICRSAAIIKKKQESDIKAGKKLRKGVMAGPCPTCKKKYPSKNADRKYCSQECYIKSDDFRRMYKQNCKKGNKTQEKKMNELMTKDCLACKESFRAKRSANNKRGASKFCSQLCYRKFKADLFDAWVANPQDITIPQNYDEFMTQTNLPCLIDGCTWSGRHLSVHLNKAHGVLANDFKRAAGFNLGTGLVSPDLHKELCDRDNRGLAAHSDMRGYLHEDQNKTGYVSRERIESAKKSRAMSQGIKGPERICKNCLEPFLQNTVFGKAIYCGISCRDEYYKRSRSAKNKQTTNNNEVM